jgi:neutral amino acid transport system ATP-binding protein
MTALIETSAITMRFGGIQALNNCCLTVEGGTIAGLVGPNGSGKTTLFNCISGFLRPDSGTIVFDGRNITGSGARRVFRLGLARTFQRPRVFDRLTVLENALVGARRDEGWMRALVTPPGSRREQMRASAVLEFVGLSELRGSLAGELSFGQRKLLELAYLLVGEPRVILLDEPAGGINPSLRNRLADRIRELNGQGVTFLIVEHDMQFVSDLCDVVTVLDQGRAIAAGTPAAIQQNPAVLEAYLGGSETASAR